MLRNRGPRSPGIRRIRFKSFRYFDLPLSKYVKEEVSIRYDPRDMSEIFVYADGKFACKAFCRELEGKETNLREIIKERTRCKKEVKAAVVERQKLAELHMAPMPATNVKDITEKAAKAEPTRRIIKYFYERERSSNTPGN